MYSYIYPYSNSFTIYTKSNCIYCLKVKQMLSEFGINFFEINCDKYIEDNKYDFLRFINILAKKQHNTFPIVFDNSTEFIGGYIETLKFFEKQNIQFHEDF